MHPSETSDFKRRISRMSPDRAVRLKRWGQSLAARINQKELNQSEFASRVAIHTRDKRMGRDLISNYIRGVSEPTPLKQIAMAKALGISVEELMSPMGIMAPIDRRETTSLIEMQAISPTRARLEINAEVPYETAVEILKLIHLAGK